MIKIRRKYNLNKKMLLHNDWDFFVDSVIQVYKDLKLSKNVLLSIEEKTEYYDPIIATTEYDEHNDRYRIVFHLQNRLGLIPALIAVTHELYHCHQLETKGKVDESAAESFCIEKTTDILFKQNKLPRTVVHGSVLMARCLMH